MVIFANIWMHIGLLQVDGEKMSKSLGNFHTIRDVLKNHDAELIRYFMISGHYRSPVNYSEENLLQLRSGLDRLYTAMRGLPVTTAKGAESFRQAFYVAMDDDFNTPVAMSVLFELAHHIQRLREQSNNEQAAACATTLRELGATFSMLQQDPEAYFQGEKNSVDVSKIESLINERNQARQEKNWQKADEIRNTLIEMGIVIEDTADNTIWRVQASTESRDR